MPVAVNIHMAKVAEHCIDKYVKDSGIKDVLVETAVFGPKVVGAIMSGSHYERSLRGMQIIYDVLQNFK